MRPVRVIPMGEKEKQIKPRRNGPGTIESAIEENQSGIYIGDDRGHGFLEISPLFFRLIMMAFCIDYSNAPVWFGLKLHAEAV